MTSLPKNLGPRRHLTSVDMTALDTEDRAQNAKLEADEERAQAVDDLNVVIAAGIEALKDAAEMLNINNEGENA